MIRKSWLKDKFILDNNGEYGELIGDQCVYFKTKGFHESFLRINKLTPVALARKFFTSVAREYSDSFNTVVGFEDGRIHIMFECPKEKLTSRVLNALLSEKVLFGCDDFFIQHYALYEEEQGRFVRSCDHYQYNYVLKHNALIDCIDYSRDTEPEYYSKSVNAILPDNIQGIKETAFTNYNGINLMVKKTIKEFISMYNKLTKKENLFGYVRCTDGCLLITNIKHKKSGVPLLLSGIHMCMMEPKAAIQCAKEKKYFAFLKNVPGLFIRTHGKMFFADVATPYEDFENGDEEFSALDFDNFNHIEEFDFTAS